jgi:hypothetical protein
MIVFSRGASFDIVITMTTTWALSFFFLQEMAETSRAKALFLAGFYAAVGLSLLAKGLVGIVIPFGVVTIYYLLRRELAPRQVRLSLIWGTPIALAVSAIWYGPVISRHGWLFIDQFFIQHHFARYISNKYHHPQPVYFYLLILVPLTLPWTAFFLDGIARIRSWQWRGNDALSKLRVFSFAWLLLPILFFSFSGSKLPGYILPVLPAASLLAGERLSRLQRLEAGRSWPLRVTGTICLLLGASGLVYAARSANLTMPCAILITLPLFVAGFFAVIAVRLPSTPAILIGCGTLAALVMVLTCGGGKLAQRESVRDLLQLADARGYAGAPVFARRGDDRTAEFYASGRVVYGADGDVVVLDEVPQMLTEERKHGGPILVFMPIEYLEQPGGSHGAIIDTYGNVPGAVLEVLGNNGKVAVVGVKPR